MNSAKPNILFLHAHDMGRYNACYGYAAPTPCMQKLTREGMLMRDAHCAAPTCSPSRAALLTGQTAHEAGMTGLVHRGFDLSHPERHLAAYLLSHGYTTALSGIQHEFNHKHLDKLYDHHLTPETLHGKERDAAAATAAAEFIAGKEPAPWMLWVGFFLPHRPFVPVTDGPVRPNDVLPPAPMPDTPAVREDMAAYYNSVAHTDRLIGDILAALDSSGQSGNTLVVLTTDHGIAFPHMKCHLTGHGTGVTLGFRYPGQVKADATCDALVSHMDVFPTVCDFAGIPTPEWAGGNSLKALLAGGLEEIRDDLFGEVNFHAAREPMRSVRSKRYNYIRIYDDDLRVILGNTDGGLSRDELYATEWPDRLRDEEQLYDLYFDPQEMNNVAGDPGYANVLEEFRGRLDAWMEKTDDPLLHPPLEAPEGARINPPRNILPG